MCNFKTYPSFTWWTYSILVYRKVLQKTQSTVYLPDNRTRLDNKSSIIPKSWSRDILFFVSKNLRFMKTPYSTSVDPLKWADDFFFSFDLNGFITRNEGLFRISRRSTRHNNHQQIVHYNISSQYQDMRRVHGLQKRRPTHT